MHGRLTSAKIQTLLKEGFSEVDIAQMYGMSRQNVNRIKLQDPDYKRTPRQQVKEWFPFEVNDSYTRNYIDRRLRDHGEYMITNGKDMSSSKLDQLEEFYRYIKDNKYVIEFNPEKAEGTSEYGGYLYQDRTDEDGDWIIRWNKFAVQVPQEGIRIWRLPRRHPC